MTCDECEILGCLLERRDYLMPSASEFLTRVCGRGGRHLVGGQRLIKGGAYLTKGRHKGVHNFRQIWDWNNINIITNTTTDFCLCWILLCIEVTLLTSDKPFQISYNCARKNEIAGEIFGRKWGDIQQKEEFLKF